jgi:hypothetical protein
VRRLTTNFPCSRVHRFAGRRFPRRQLHNCSIVVCIEVAVQSIHATCSEFSSVAPSRQRLMQEVQRIDARRIVQSLIGADVCSIISSKPLHRRRLGPYTPVRYTFCSTGLLTAVKHVTRALRHLKTLRPRCLGPEYLSPLHDKNQGPIEDIKISHHHVCVLDRGYECLLHRSSHRQETV